MFKVQRYQFARYHVTNAGDFYQGNNRWAVPQDPYASGQYQPPYRLFVNEAGEQNFALTSTYVPSGKSNLAAFVSVNADATDADGYGKMRVLQLPNEQTPGPGQVANDMATDQDVRDALLEFSAGGSDVRTNYGNLLTLPIGDGLMYVQPVYASRELVGGQLPRAAVRDRVVRRRGGHRPHHGRGARGRPRRQGPTPPEPGEEPPAGEEPGTGEPPTAQTINAQIRQKLTQAQAAFDRAAEAQADGDTITWAEEIERAQRLVTQAVALANRRDQAAAPPASGG